MSRRKTGQSRVLPGFGLTLGFSVAYLSLVVLVPLSALLINSAGLDWAKFWQVATDPRVLASYRISFTTSAAAALVDAVLGLLLAWVLVRYEFPGRKLCDALIDLPFALPTAVAGVSLTALYAPNGWIGSLLAPLGVKVAFSQLGITLALMFIGLPFVVRTLQPSCRIWTAMPRRLPPRLGPQVPDVPQHRAAWLLVPPLLTYFALAFARGIGEYGSVVFISGNMPMKTEIAPLLIMSKLEQYDYAGASAVAVLLLLISFLMLLVINSLQRWSSRKKEAV